MTSQQKIRKILEHTELVRMNCEKLGMWYLDNGREAMGRLLIANSLAHDESKFRGYEWSYLWDDADPVKFKLAHEFHVEHNRHHPEAWGGIHNMPEIWVAEMVCDWKARATEFGTSLLDWVQNEAKGRYGFSEGDQVYGWIVTFLHVLCEKPFTKKPGHETNSVHSVTV